MGLVVDADHLHGMLGEGPNVELEVVIVFGIDSAPEGARVNFEIGGQFLLALLVDQALDGAMVQLRCGERLVWLEFEIRVVVNEVVLDFVLAVEHDVLEVGLNELVILCVVVLVFVGQVLQFVPALVVV